MSSQLNVDTIVDKAGSGGTNVKIGNTSTYVSDGGATTQNTVQGLCKTWVNFDAASSNNIDDSFNTASIQDDATGNHRVNFTNNFGNTNYLHIGCTAGDGGSTGDHGFVPYNIQSGGTTSQSFQLRPSDYSGNRRDCNNVYHMSNGDLA